MNYIRSDRVDGAQPKQGDAQLEYLDPEEETITPLDDASEAAARPPMLVIERATQKRRLGRWLLVSLLLLSAAIATESTLLIVESFEQHWLLGSLWAGGLALALLLMVVFMVKEVVLLRRLKQRWRRQQQPSAEHVLHELKHPDLAHAWEQIEQPYWNDDERQERFEKDIVSRIDQQAQRIISKRAAESAALVALSPSSVADMLLLLWRNHRMMTDIAACYGVELGYWSRIGLWRQILTNLAYAGMSELAVDLGTQWLSAELMTKLSARAGQGLGAGLLTARLGFQVIDLTRPLPFTHVKRPGYARLQKDILAQLSQLLPSVYRKTKHADNGSSATPPGSNL